MTSVAACAQGVRRAGCRAIRTARSWRDILPLTHLAREGRMTVTIGRRELLAALGGATACRSRCGRSRRASDFWARARLQRGAVSRFQRHSWPVPTRGSNKGVRRSAMADKGINIGRMINVTGMVGVSAGIVLLASGLVLLLFRRGFGLDIAAPFHWFW